MKKILCAAWLLLSVSFYAQPSPTFKKTEYDSAHSVYVVSTFNKDSILIRKAHYLDQDEKILHGKDELFYNGKTQRFWTFSNGKKDGEQRTFWNNGNVKRIENYKDAIRVDGKCFDENGNEIPFFESESRPQYPGGTEALYAFIGQSFNKGRNKSSGKIYTSFVIEKDGSVVEAKIINGINPELDAEALRVINSMPKWTPGQQDGRPVRVFFKLPINLN